MNAEQTYPSVIVMDKKVGETPLEALERVRREYRIAATVPMTYAGRLDPLASGVLVLLIGDECKTKDRYTALDKEYEFEVLFGVATDTGDVLGLTQETGVYDEVISVESYQYCAERLVGKHLLEYPAYSSQPVSGKPLFMWAREDRLGEIDIPSREMEVGLAEFLGRSEVTSTQLLQRITQYISLVQGDFRQKEIVTQWTRVLGVDRVFQIGKFRITCQSGTYVRALIGEIGKWVGVPTLAYSIRRTRVGTYTLDSCITFKS